MILQLLIAMVAGWLQRHQQQVITYLLAENRVLKIQLGGHRLRLTDTERRRLLRSPIRSGGNAPKRSRRSPPPTLSCAGVVLTFVRPPC
jgi:hypothetical protein